MSVELASSRADLAPPSAGTRLVEFAERHRVLLAGLFLLVFPLILPFHALAVVILTYGLYALGFNLLFGYLGLLSFGHAALFGGGAYLCGMALVHLGWPWWLGVIGGTVGGMIIALVMGAIAIRTRGIYFAMVTLALAQCVYYLFYQAVDLTGGENGLRLPSLAALNLFGLKLSFVDPLTRYYVVAAFVFLSLFVLSRILASPFGAVIEAIRENEARAVACGYDVTRSRLLAFVLSGGFCGLAGALQALHLAIVPVETLSIETSGLAVMMCLLGGMGTFFGPFVGAAVFLYLEDIVTTLTRHWMAVVGIIFMLFVLFFPRGIWGTVLHSLRRSAAMAVPGSRV
jgi:branched-chain amino acid transport system permease protein